MSAFMGQADLICSALLFRSLTHSRPQAHPRSGPVSFDGPPSRDC